MPDVPVVVSVVFFVAVLGLALLLIGRGGRSSRTTTTNTDVLHEIHKRSTGGNLP